MSQEQKEAFSTEAANVFAEEILIKNMNEEIDEDGYAVGDPYADAAKEIDEQGRVKKNAKTGSFKKQLAETILENKETVGFIERNLKSALALFALFYLIISSKEFSDRETSWRPSSDVMSAIYNANVFKDFMKKEGIMMFIAIGGFYAAARYNQYLDKLDHEHYLKEKRAKKEQKLKNTIAHISEDDESEETNSDEDTRRANKQPLVYPINPDIKEE